jgi:hypothetical protein
MAQILGSVRVGGFIAPTDSTDTYATHDSIYGRGGHREVDTIAERDAIPEDRARAGMTVYVDETGLRYRYTGTGWTEDTTTFDGNLDCGTFN